MKQTKSHPSCKSFFSFNLQSNTLIFFVKLISKNYTHMSHVQVGSHYYGALPNEDRSWNKIEFLFLSLRHYITRTEIPKYCPKSIVQRFHPNVCLIRIHNKHSSNTLLSLLRFSMRQTLYAHEKWGGVGLSPAWL